MTLVSIFHDYFAIRGGGERLVLELARDLEARLVYGYQTDESYDATEFPSVSHDLRLGSFTNVRGLTPLALAFGFASERRRAASCDVRIFSGVSALFAAPGAEAPGVNIFYCHTPPRFLYDQRAFFQARSGPVRRLGLALVGPLFKRAYERAVGRMDVIVSNSENIRQRVRAFLGFDSVVVYPPIDTEGFCWGEPQGYYLSTARLTPLKRVRTIVEAFLSMPDRQLIVASGGDQEDELRALARGAPNIRFTGWTNDEELKALVGGAIATIYIPVEEDFGMSPVESMAAGKPVIGVAEGGLLETIAPDETGLLLQPDPAVSDVVEAVRSLTAERALEMRAACEARAQLFGRERFLESMRQVIAQAQIAKSRS